MTEKYEITYGDFQLQIKVGQTVRRISDGREVKILSIMDLEAGHNASNLQEQSDDTMIRGAMEEGISEEDAKDYLRSCFAYGIPGLIRMVKVEDFSGDTETIPLEDLVPLTNLQDGDLVDTARGTGSIAGFANYEKGTLMIPVMFWTGAIVDWPVDKLRCID